MTPIDAILVFLFAIALGAVSLVLTVRFVIQRKQTLTGKIVLIGLGLLLAVFLLSAIREIRKTKEERILQGRHQNDAPPPQSQDTT